LKNSYVGWMPPADLVACLERRSPRDKVVYIGFGSIVVPDPKGLTKMIVEAVKRTKVRVVLSKGWSGRNKEGEATDVGQDPSIHSDLIYQVTSIPHDYLFPQLDAVIHHGGAGTVAAGLREGRPTAICPFFGDQSFWAMRIEQLGVGVGVKKLTANNLASALTTITTDPDMAAKAEELGRKIRAEDGLGVAVDSFWKELPRARRLIEDLRDQHQYSSDIDLRDPTRSFMGDDAPTMLESDGIEEDYGPRRRSFRETVLDFTSPRTASPSPPRRKSRTPSPTRTTVLRGNSFEYSQPAPQAGKLSVLSALTVETPRNQMRQSSKSSPSLLTDASGDSPDPADDGKPPTTV
jgi:hypothetical protein